MNILLLIPALNEGRTISGVVSAARNYVADVLVVDDGSTDGTASAAAAAGAKVLKHPANLGKGIALKTGFAFAMERGYDWVFTIDSDGQHDPRDLRRLFPLLENYDIVLGSRLHDPGRMPFFRRHANRILSAVVSLACSQVVKDSQTGFRAYRVDVLRMITLGSRRYELETEVLIKACRKNFRIGHCDIRTIYAGEVSRFRKFSDSISLFSVVARSCLWWG